MRGSPRRCGMTGFGLQSRDCSTKSSSFGSSVATKLVAPPTPGVEVVFAFGPFAAELRGVDEVDVGEVLRGPGDPLEAAFALGQVGAGFARPSSRGSRREAAPRAVFGGGQEGAGVFDFDGFFTVDPRVELPGFV